jgi:hypothetical protein
MGKRSRGAVIRRIDRLIGRVRHNKASMNDTLTHLLKARKRLANQAPLSEHEWGNLLRSIIGPKVINYRHGLTLLQAQPVTSQVRKNTKIWQLISHFLAHDNRPAAVVTIAAATGLNEGSVHGYMLNVYRHHFEQVGREAKVGANGTRTLWRLSKKAVAKYGTDDGRRTP